MENKEINYDELLNEWFDLVMKESDKSKKEEENEFYRHEYSFRQGILRGYSDGLIMATSILSNLERKKRIRNNKPDFSIRTEIETVVKENFKIQNLNISDVLEEVLNDELLLTIISFSIFDTLKSGYLKDDEDKNIAEIKIAEAQKDIISILRHRYEI